MKKVIIAISFLIMSFRSKATLISVELNQSSYEVGDVLTADFIISDIEEEFGIQKLLASFAFNVSWDNAMIEYVSTTFGNKLNVGLFGSDQGFADVMTNNADISETSFAWWDELLPVQGGLSQFVLASINFTVIDLGNGSGSLNLTEVLFGDDFGAAFTEVSSMDKTYSVTSGNATDVPEPATLMLMLLSLSFLVRQRTMQ
jgi:hypothetical protein